MKRGIILTIEALMLMALLQSSFVQYWLADLQEEATQWLIYWENYEEQQSLLQLRQITLQSHHLNHRQQDYLNGITQSREQLARFERLYCQQGDINPFLYGATLRHFCHAIDSQGVLLE